MPARYDSAPPVPPILVADHQLPLHRPIAIYYRQSNERQIGNVSTSIQTVDMVSYLMKLGWLEDQMILIDQDAGISGTTTIMERPGMKLLCNLICEGKIGAVACLDEDRLFRDGTQIQVNIFLEACKANRVLVLTPSMVYDFANELTGAFHAHQFPFKSEMAAEYIHTIVRGKMNRAQKRLQMEGYWAGGAISPGFMVDQRKILPDHSKNPHRRCFVPFEPYAAVIREYFRIFLAFEGNLLETAREVEAHGPFYPDPNLCHPPQGYQINYNIHRYQNGYHPSMQGLRFLLTNAAYIGHWAVKKVIVRWNNHPAIVPAEVFMQAFNYLSLTNLEGKPNLDCTHIVVNRWPPQAKKNRSVEQPLLTGLLVGKINTQWRKMSACWNVNLKKYTYVLWKPGRHHRYSWAKKAEKIDELVSQLFLDSWSHPERVSTPPPEPHADHAKEMARLTSLQTVINNLALCLDTLTHPDLIKSARARLEQAHIEYSQLSTEQAGSQRSDMADRKKYIQIKDNYTSLPDGWVHLSQEAKRKILRILIERVEATWNEKGELHLSLFWKDGYIAEKTYSRMTSGVYPWTDQETQKLFDLVDRHASQVEIAQEFPERTWMAIQGKVSTIRGPRTLKIRPLPIRYEETYLEYLARTSEQESSHG